MVPAAVATLRRELPAVDVRLLQAEPPQCHDLVRRGELELAVTYRFDALDQTAADSRLGQPRRLPLFLDQVRLMLPVDHPAAHRRLIEPTELADDTWILASRRFEDLLRGVASRAGFEPRIMLVADDYVVMQSLVAHELGVTLVPELALSAHRDDRLVARTLVGWPDRQVEVELWPDQLRVPAVAAMLEALKKAAPAAA